jgi:hypothetical protein
MLRSCVSAVFTVLICRVSALGADGFFWPRHDEPDQEPDQDE